MQTLRCMANETERYREYIRLTYTNHLERLMGQEVEGGYWYGPMPEKGDEYVRVLHATMLPYYKQYLYGDIRLCCDGQHLEFIGKTMAEIIREDRLFGQWASEQNLKEAAESWGDNMKRYDREQRRIYRFFHVLEALFEADCRQDWTGLSDELKQMLFKAEVCYDYKTDEVLCVLHGFCQIMRQEWPKEKKREQIALLSGNWLFLKHYYSVMTRHIIGVRLTRFHKVAETVMSASQSFKPHMHIFYCGLLDCANELQLDRRHQRELEKAVAMMQDELTRVEPSDLLYELCDALFPEEFQRLLREHRPKSYREVEDESHKKDELIKQMQKQNQLLRNDLNETKEVLQQMILSSIPIADVDAELEQYPPAMAWELLCKLNESPILNAFEAWHNAYPTLLKKYRGRLMESMNLQKELSEAIKEGVNRPTYNYQAGATHDDKRSQLVFGEEKETSAQIKRLTNE